ncbi:MAG: protein kinase [Acidobacteriota bacterium]|nr:MAG: protein kinase [Acidobacteriota bacterium]
MELVRKTVSHYKILKKIGAGGMSEVYKAEDTRLGRNVALKFLPVKFAQDRLALERFTREARAASALDHPNICTIHDVGEHEGQPFIVMQFLEGRTLRELIKRAPFEIEQILDISIQVSSALDKAHEKGIIHRDIKTGNIILTHDGLAKILDFGLAKLNEEQSSTPDDRKTSPGVPIGTTLYMSPEQVRAEELTPRTDLFSLGVIIYEMATGRLPYSGTTSGAVFDEILNKAPISPVRINPHIPDALEHIILKCLEKDPELRYQSARELLADLRRLSRDSGRSLTDSSPTLTLAKTKPQRGLSWQQTAAIAALLSAFFLAWWMGVFDPSPVDASVGVIPFSNSSGDANQEALADGLTEDIVAQLSKISGLSVYRFRGLEESPQDKAAELGVATLLEGTVRRVGNKIRISTQFTESQSGRVLWSENYDQELTDIFNLQTEIALQVASALQVELLPAEKTEVEINPTDSIEAYDLYLQGRFLRHTQENPEGLRQAVEYFRQAIAKDNQYALAYAGLAECYFMLASIYGAEPWEKFGDAARSALQYGENLPEPHVAMGLWLDFWDDDAEGADAEFRRALEIDPRQSNARREYSRFLMRRGRFGEALREIEKVHDPMFAVTVHLTRAEIYRYRGQYDAALQEAHRFSEIWTGSDEPLLQMALCYAAMVEYEKAEQLAARISQDHPARDRLLSLIHLLQGRMQEAKVAADRLILLQPEVPFSWWVSGYVKLWNGENAAAQADFERAYQLKATDDLNWWRPYATYLGKTLWNLGDTQSANRFFNERLAADQNAIDAGSQYPDLLKDRAVIYATRGEIDNALQWMQRAVDSGYLLYDIAERDGLLQPLYEEPRFQQMMREAESRVEGMRRRAEIMERDWPDVHP